MYGYEPDPYPYRDYYGGIGHLRPDPAERLRLVAYVDGRLVETWTEPVRACLLRVWDREPDVVLDAVTAAHVAGGVAWLVAKANGVLGPHGRVTVTRLKEELALHATPSTYGKVVQRALVGYRDFASERTGRLYELPDLLPLGHPDLLLASTRRTLCRARDRALEAQQATAA